MIHKTDGIVFKTIKYGETSIVSNVYTELFGMQSYIVKGVRKSGKKSASKQNYFQPGAILQMEVYHYELKNLQFIKEYEWAYQYKLLFYDVVRNAIAMYLIEVLQRSLKQPESNPQLFYFITHTLKVLDTADVHVVSNLLIFFLIHYTVELGFRLYGNYTESTQVLDMQEGQFVAEKPLHPHYVDGPVAQHISIVKNMEFLEQVKTLQLNRQARRDILKTLQIFIQFHIPDFGELRSLGILEEVLS